MEWIDGTDLVVEVQHLQHVQQAVGDWRLEQHNFLDHTNLAQIHDALFHRSLGNCYLVADRVRIEGIEVVTLEQQVEGKRLLEWHNFLDRPGFPKIQRTSFLQSLGNRR